MKITIVIPTYNEAENLPELAAALWMLDVKGDLDVLVVDDDSPDGTGAIADELSTQGPLSVIHRKGKLGLGTAYKDGFRRALEKGADVIVQMDADFSHSPDYIPQLIAKLGEGCDVAVGSRYVAGGSVDERWSPWRVFVSWWANNYTRIILRFPVKDQTAGFKAWKAETLRGLDLGRVWSNGYVFQVEMAYLAHKLGYKICEIPIYFEDRRIGQSKMDMPVKLEAAWRTWQVWRRHRSLTPADRAT